MEMRQSDHPLHRSLVTARDVRGAIVGVGFLAAPGLIRTCAHVVARALGLPENAPPTVADEIGVNFPFVTDATTRAIVARWLPIQPGGGGDVAVLRLTTGAPSGTSPASLLAAGNLAGRRFEV